MHKEYENALGAKVLEINKISIEEVLQRIAPVIASENDQYFKAYGLNSLRIPEVLHALASARMFLVPSKIGKV